MNRLSPAALVLFAMVSLSALAAPSRAADQVPFAGTLDGDVTTALLAPPMVQVDIEASGHANQLGAFTVSIPHLVNRATRTAAGAYVFTAANGDTLTATFVGQSTPTAPGILTIAEVATITGGTGRFADASGGFVTVRVYDTVAGTTTGTFEGTISSPGASKK